MLRVKRGGEQREGNAIRQTIVRRRAQFVASALAAAGVIAQAGPSHAQDAPDTGVGNPADAAFDSGDADEVEPEVCLCACEAAGAGDAPAGLFPIAVAGLLVLRRRKRRPDARRDTEP